MFQNIPLAKIDESPTNPRKRFDEAALEELADSIRVHGVLQPIIVREGGTNHYEIVSGARRYRAAVLAELEEIPARVVEMDDEEVLEVQIVENLQRVDVHPLDEAEGFLALRRHLNVEGVAGKVGKSESYVMRRLKLCDLVEEGKRLYFAGHMGLGQAEAVARLRDEDQKAVLEACWEDPDNEDFEAPTVTEIRQYVQRNITLDLEAARFRRDDAKLVKAAGPCSSCPKRSGAQPALFADLDGRNLCLDKTCYHAKTAAHWAQQQKLLQKEHGCEVKLISMNYDAADGVLANHQWEEADEPTNPHAQAEAVLGLVVNAWRDEDIGKTKWIAEIEDPKRWDEDDEEETDKPTLSKAERAAKEKQAREEREAEWRRERLEKDMRIALFRAGLAKMTEGVKWEQLAEVLYKCAEDELNEYEPAELKSLTGAEFAMDYEGNMKPKGKLTPLGKLRVGLAVLVRMNYALDEEGLTKTVTAFAKSMGVDTKAVKKAVEKSLKADEEGGDE